MKEKTQTINRSLKILIVTLLMGTMPVYAVNTTGAHTLAPIGAETPQAFVEKTFPDKKVSVADDCSVKDKTCGVAAESGPVALYIKQYKVVDLRASQDISILYDENDKELDKYQDLYDTETDHSKNIEKQKEWNERIEKQLKELEQYSQIQLSIKLN